MPKDSTSPGGSLDPVCALQNPTTEFDALSFASDWLLGESCAMLTVTEGVCLTPAPGLSSTTRLGQDGLLVPIREEEVVEEAVRTSEGGRVREGYRLDREERLCGFSAVPTTGTAGAEVESPYGGMHDKVPSY